MLRTPVDPARSAGGAPSSASSSALLSRLVPTLLAVLLVVAAGAFGAPAQARATSHSTQARTAGHLAVRAGHVPRVVVAAQSTVRHADPDTGPAPVVPAPAVVVPGRVLGTATTANLPAGTGAAPASERHTRAPPV